MEQFLASFHPKIIHFPIVLLLGYVFFEILYSFSKKEFYSKTANLLLFLGVVFALFAVFTGQQAAAIASQWNDKGANIPLNAIEEHEDAANLVLWYFVGLLVLRIFLYLKKKLNSNLKYLLVILAILGSYFVYQAGELGGKLVYKYGVGTQLKFDETQNNN